MKPGLTAASLALLVLTPQVVLGQVSIDLQRQILVEQATHDAQLDTAIMGLRELYQRTDNIPVRSDLIALLIRAEQHTDALAVCADCTLEDYTENELLDLGGAARAVGDTQLALSYFSHLAYRDPTRPEAWLGQALVHIDLNNIILAESALRRFEQLSGSTLEAIQARGYLAAATNHLVQELQVRQTLVEQQPENNNEILALYRLAIRLGASEPARELLAQYPDLFTASDTLWLLYYEGVNDIRLGVHVEDPALVEQGLNQLERVLQSAALDPDLEQLTNYDRIVALTQLRRFAEAEAASQHMLREHGTLPHYVQRARAQALSGLGKPEQAITLYYALLEEAPERGTDLNDPLYEGLFYSYADARRFPQAHRLLQEWQNLEPRYRLDFTGTTHIQNPNLEKVLMLDIMLQAWRGNEQEAYEQVNQYLAEAPYNPYLWIVRGDLNRWRGWPEKAQADYQHAATLLGPEQQEIAHHGELMAKLQQNNWPNTVSQVREEIAFAPPSVSRDGLEREWREQRAAELALSIERSDGQGRGTQASKEWLADTIFRSPRNDNGSRYYLQHRHQQGTFAEGKLRAGYAIAGYEWNRFPSYLTLAAGHGLELNDEPHFSAELRHDFTDQLAVTLEAEYNSLTTPLRALNDDIYANRYATSVTYRHDEARTLGAGIAVTDFDDGNLRRNASGYWEERLYQHDRWSLIGTGRVGGSRNDDVGANYFNPERDFYVDGELTLEYAYPLGYRQTFTQGVTLGAGQYWQKDESSDDTWQIGYHHRWEFAPRLSVEYGITRARSIYDGQAEYDTILSGGLVWRFP